MATNVFPTDTRELLDPPRNPDKPNAITPGSACPQDASAEERVRSLELAKYFSSASVTPVSDHEHNDIQRPEALPHRALDANLTALAQLGCFRLECDRAFISLIDRTHQYIIGEATRTTVILPPDGKILPTDNLYLGTQALEFHFGICPQTIEIFTTPGKVIDTANISADQHRYIIRDFCADAYFSTRPYVAGWPHMRSYLEVPLTTEHGYVIGSYCVVDTRPRNFSSLEVAQLTHIAACILNQLDLCKRKLELGRVDKLLRGIGLYVGGHSGLQEHQTQKLPTVESQRPPNLGRAKSVGIIPSSAFRGSFSHETVGILPSSTFRDSVSHGAAISHDGGTGTLYSVTAAITPFSEVPPPLDSPGWSQESPRVEASQRQENEDLVRDGPTAAHLIQQAIARASNLIRQSMEVDGVVVLDASWSDYDHSQQRLDEINSLQPDIAAAAGKTYTGVACGLLGYSTKTHNNMIEIQAEHQLPRIDQSLLQRILLHFPFGHIYPYDELGLVSTPVLARHQQNRIHPSRMRLGKSGMISDPPNTTSVEKDAAVLHASIPQARSLIVLPLWNYQTDRWFAALLGWTTSPARVFDASDLNYLSAFGNSITAEVSRIEAATLSRSKSDFISSISHELRSPLHGILAGVEILRESVGVSKDSSMLDTIDACGNMLLDTMNHLLDYAKINSLTRQSASRNPVSQPEQYQHPVDGMTRHSVVNLADLVQDVVEGVYLGHFGGRPELRNALDNAKLAPGLPRVTLPDAVGVFVDINPQYEWNFQAEAGAWKRIVMNLFGNALKFTTQGEINVKLNIVEAFPEQDGSNANAPMFIRLEVTDTGRGMGAEYLKHRLFTPFAQETHLSVGTGLGLSIVKQLVDAMSGTIDVQSRLQSGTQIGIMVPIGQDLRPAAPVKAPARHKPAEEYHRLKGRVLVARELPLYDRDAVHIRNATIRSWVINTARDWLGMHTVTDFSSLDLEHMRYEESHINLLPRALSDDHLNASSWWLTRPILGATEDDVSPMGLELANPFTPRRLVVAITSIEGEWTRSAHPSRTVSPDTKAQHKSILQQHETEGMASGAASPSLAPLTEPPLSSNPSKTILLVDDNRINLKVLSLSVKKAGCNYSTALNGLQALQTYKDANGAFDLVFMDISMPVMDGFAATRHIREFEKEAGLRRCRILALTALGSAEARQEATMSGIDDFLEKPVKLSRLRELVSE